MRYLRHSRFEVIVVNGPSEDETEDVLLDFSKDIRTGHVSEANLSKSRNVGIAMARGDIVCFLDDDATPEPDWLNALESRYVDDDTLGAVGGFIRDHSGVNFQCRVVVCDRFGDSKTFDDIESAHQSIVSDDPGSWEYISQTGCNSSFRRSALLQVGGFDEEFAYFLDETDVNLRVRDSGWAVTIEPTAEVHHKYAPSHLRDNERIPQRLYLPLRSKSYFALRHARCQKSLAEILTKLSDHAVQIHGYNKWYIDNKVIAPDHYKQLTDDVNKGILDGIKDAFSKSEPALLKQELLDHYADEPFKTFRTLKPKSERLRICYLSQDYPPDVNGGIGVWTHLMATSMAAEGHEVTVITKSSTGVHTVDFEQGVWVHRVVPHYDTKRNEPSLGDLPQVIKDYAYTVYDEAVRIHLRRGIDLISAPIWDLEGIACLNSGLFKVVTSLHTTFGLALPHKPDWQNNSKYRRSHVDKIIAVEEDLLTRAPHLMSNSHALLEDLTQLHSIEDLKTRSVVIPHGLKAGTLPAVSKDTDDDCIKLLFVGRLENRKGADLLLNVLPDLLQKYEKLVVNLLGDDTQLVGQQTLKQQFLNRHAKRDFHDRITFHGYVDNAQCERAYTECDMFVAPSRYESFGLIFLEAMRAGKACIGSRVGGIQEVLTHNETGLLVEPGDEASLRAAIEQLIEDKGLRERLGHAGRNDFEIKFRQERVNEQAEEYYRSLLETEIKKVVA